MYLEKLELNLLARIVDINVENIQKRKTLIKVNKCLFQR